jgi:diguanylate cyclase (GGDEF)-like protein
MLSEMQKQVGTRKLEILYGQLYFSLLFSAVLFISLSYVFRAYLSLFSLSSWLVIFLSITVIRFFLTYNFNHAENVSSNLNYWFSLHMFGVLISAITWGGFILLLAISANPTHLSLLMICAAGLSAGAAGDYSFSFYSFIAFAIPLLTPTGIFLLTANDPTLHTQGYFVLLFLVIMSLLSWRLNRTTTKSLNAQFENQALKILSTKDGLTEINNRRRFDESLHAEWYRASRLSSPLSLIICDIDKFKEYNDTYGHLEGDKCLIRVAHLIEDYARRAGDMSARFGGEEFALILPDTQNEHAKDIAEQVRMTLVDIAIPHSGSSVANIVTASFGVYTTVPKNDCNPESLIESADKALYQAKDRGRNMVVSYNENPENII